jgi:hypothetical protein
MVSYGPNRDRYHFCGMHVEKWAYVIAAIGAILCIIYAVLQFFTGNWILAIIGVIFALIFLSIIGAQRKRNPSLYMPFLVVIGIAMFLLVIYIFFLIVMLITMPDFWVDSDNFWIGKNRYDERRGDRIEATRVFTWLQLIYSIIMLALLVLFWSIIWRAYEYLRDEFQRPGYSSTLAAGRPGYVVNSATTTTTTGGNVIGSGMSTIPPRATTIEVEHQHREKAVHIPVNVE